MNENEMKNATIADIDEVIHPCCRCGGRCCAH